MCGTPIKDDVQRLLDHSALAFSNSPVKSQQEKDQKDSAQYYARSEKWKKRDWKNIAASFGYMFLLKLKKFLLRRFRFVFCSGTHVGLYVLVLCG